MIMKNENRKSNYVHQVRENTQNYFKDLLVENEKLRAQIAALESDVRLFREKIRAAESSSAVNDALRVLISSLDEEKLRLQKQLILAQEEQQRREQERILLQKRLEEI